MSNPSPRFSTMIVAPHAPQASASPGSAAPRLGSLAAKRKYPSRPLPPVTVVPRAPSPRTPSPRAQIRPRPGPRRPNPGRPPPSVTPPLGIIESKGSHFHLFSIFSPSPVIPDAHHVPSFSAVGDSQ
jgi:hypothetical protein